RARFLSLKWPFTRVLPLLHSGDMISRSQYSRPLTLILADMMDSKRCFIFRCECCGRQWLNARACCEQDCVLAPLRPYSLADSIHAPSAVEFSVVLPFNHNVTSVRRTLA